MASRFTLPHIEITRFKSQQAYTGVGGGGNSAVRIREEHGRRLKGELDAALKLADEMRTKDVRLPASTTSIIEVGLRRGADPKTLDRKKADIRSSAAKADDRNERTIAVFVPDGSKDVLESILNDYLNSPL